MSLYEYVNQDPSYTDKWKDENVKEYKEALFDRISQLLIEHWTEIEPYLAPDLNKDGSVNELDKEYVEAMKDEHGLTIKSLQKVIRDQEIQVGVHNEDESIVIYQSDLEANNEDKDILNGIFTYFNFANPMNIDLDVVGGNSEDGDMSNWIKLKLTHSAAVSSTYIIDIPEQNINNVRIKDNVSQFIEIFRKKTSLNTGKLPEYIDSTFIELKPKR